MTTLYSILVLFGLALLFGIALGYVGNKLAVPVDEKQEFVVSKLTGANCGGCGYAGCADYARALCEGRASLNDCASTPRENKAEIAAALGLDATGEDCKLVVCCSGGNACKDKYDYQGYGNCQSMNLLSGGKKACPVGCMGAGSCNSACHNGSAVVDKNEGCAVINQDTCVHCGLCKKACPKGLIVSIPVSAKVYVACMNHEKAKAVRENCKHGCIGCGLCAKLCPNGAVQLVDNLAVIDYTKCTGCGICTTKCPTKAIRNI